MAKKTLRELRKEKRYTLREMADEIGIPYGSYVGYEYQNRVPNTNVAEKIAGYYGLSVSDIDFSKKGE